MSYFFQIAQQSITSTNCVGPLWLYVTGQDLYIKKAINFDLSISLKQIESLLTIADNPHRRKTKKLTVFKQIILRFNSARN